MGVAFFPELTKSQWRAPYSWLPCSRRYGRRSRAFLLVNCRHGDAKERLNQGGLRGMLETSQPVALFCVQHHQRHVVSQRKIQRRTTQYQGRTSMKPEGSRLTCSFRRAGSFGPGRLGTHLDTSVFQVLRSIRTNLSSTVVGNTMAVCNLVFISWRVLYSRPGWHMLDFPCGSKSADAM